MPIDSQRPPDQNPADAFEIHGPGLDSQAVLARVYASIQARRAAGQAARPIVDILLDQAGSLRSEEARFYLERVHTASEVRLSVSLASSPANRLPILGRLWTLVREQAHNLVLYYVDMLARKQTDYNEAVARLLDQLVHSQEENADLKRQVLELRRRLEALESARPVER